MITPTARKSLCCPECKGHMAVHDSRAVKFKMQETIKRRRVCVDCGYRVFTYEVVGDAVRDDAFVRKLSRFMKDNPAFAPIFEELMK